jgi:hypothetical protein
VLRHTSFERPDGLLARPLLYLHFFLQLKKKLLSKSESVEGLKREGSTTDQGIPLIHSYFHFITLKMEAAMYTDTL